MHELSIASAVLESALGHAAGRRVSDVRLRVGGLRQVVPDSLGFYWDVVTRETICEGSTLDQVLIEPRLACAPCGREWTIDMPIFRCPTCGGSEVSVAAGDELELESIEVEEEPACTG
jgi:hydrogenase nickel incorporation protein HypA/HybF